MIMFIRRKSQYFLMKVKISLKLNKEPISIKIDVAPGPIAKPLPPLMLPTVVDPLRRSSLSCESDVLVLC